jgi:hypothetical protein
MTGREKERNERKAYVQGVNDERAPERRGQRSPAHGNDRHDDQHVDEIEPLARVEAALPSSREAGKDRSNRREEQPEELAGRPAEGLGSSAEPTRRRNRDENRDRESDESNPPTDVVGDQNRARRQPSSQLGEETLRDERESTDSENDVGHDESPMQSDLPGPETNESSSCFPSPWLRTLGRPTGFGTLAWHG